MIKSTNLFFFINVTKFPNQKTQATELTTFHIKKLVAIITILLFLIFLAMNIVIPVLSISNFGIFVNCILLSTYIKMIMGIWHGVIFTWYSTKIHNSELFYENNKKKSMLVWIYLSLISYFIVSINSYKSINVLYLLLSFIFTYFLITLASFNYIKNRC